MRVSGWEADVTPRRSPAVYASDVGADNEGSEDIFQVSIDPAGGDLHGEGFLVPSFSPQTCEREDTWLTISQGDHLLDALRTVFQRDENDPMELPKSSK